MVKKYVIGILTFLLLSVNGSALIVVDLGRLPYGTISTAYDINNEGLVVGMSTMVNGPKHATLWNLNNGEIIDLGVLPGDWFSIANAVNDKGDIVGWSLEVNNNGNNNYSAFIWNFSTKTISELTPLYIKSNRTIAYDINDNGIIVGESNDAYKNYAVYWNKNTGTFNILTSVIGGRLANSSFANRLNSFGQIVGHAYDYNGFQHGVVWDINGNVILKDLGINNDTKDINNLKQVVGRKNKGGVEYWDINSGIAADIGDPNSYANKINDKGGIVGQQLNPPNWNWNATYWNISSKSFIDLGNPPGGAFSEANSINEINQIVGRTYFGTTYNATLWSLRIKGDVDDSGSITASDALLYLRKAVNQNIKPFKIFAVVDDVTCDKKITASDALLVLRKSVGQNVIFC